MKILSCGAGMQSTSLALISCEQTKGIVRYPQVPRYDAVIYCDLGIEPPWVIQQVRFIQQTCESCDISFVILKSNLYQDYMDIIRYVSQFESAGLRQLPVREYFYPLEPWLVGDAADH